MTEIGWSKSNVLRACVNVFGDALVGGARQKCSGVRQHHGVVVHIDHAGIRADLLRDLVRVLHRRESGTDIQELADVFLGRKKMDGANQKPARFLGDRDDLGLHRLPCLAGSPIHPVVVLASHEVVPHARRTRRCEKSGGRRRSSIIDVPRDARPGIRF